MNCESCRNYDYCTTRNNSIERCEGYKPQKCRNCYKYPFCDKYVNPQRVCCEDFKSKRMMKEKENE